MDDLISEFITETSESLDQLDSELVMLEKNPDDESILGNIFRVMHTIKGTCGFLGLPRLESVAHAGENVMDKIRGKELEATPDAISLVLESLDRIKELIEFLEEHGEEGEGDDSDLIRRLNHYADTGTVADSEGSASSAAAGSAETAAAATSEAASDDGDFPHFMGEDDPEIAAGIARILEKEKAEKNGGDSSDAAPSDAGNDFPHFMGEDDPEIAAGIARILEAEAAKNGGDTATENYEVADAKAEPAPVAKATAPVAKTKDAGGAAKPKTKPSAAEKAPAAKAKDAGGASTSNQSIRVNIDVLENLMQMVSELVLTRNQLMQIVRDKEDNEFKAPLQQLSHITSELQEGVMQTRMQPIGNAWAKFPRLIRDLSIELGKSIELVMNGEDTELDRQLLEVIKDPLTHMVRNSCDHGVEDPETRTAAGKPAEGTVTLSAYHEGGHIIIDIKDDGRGINVERIKEKMLERELVSESALAEMSDKDIMQYIFAPGFSTAEQVTAVSGRGVGMDVVRTNIEKIGGTIELDSTWGKGSLVSIKIPLTLAIVSVLLVEVAQQRFAIPQINVLELVRLSPGAELKMEMINGAPVMRLRNKLLPLITLGNILGEQTDSKALLEKDMYVAVCRVGANDFGILVDRVFDTEEIVVKPVSSILKDISIYSGNTILGDGNVIMILDPNGLAKHANTSQIASESAQSLDVRQKNKDADVGFLLFSAGKGAPKAVPLELVSRLEEIEVKSIEIAGNNPVVQYRGDLMQLVMLSDDMQLPDSGNVEVIVFNYDQHVIGVVVDEILDIVHEPFTIKLSTEASREKGLLGSMVIAEKSTDVVDVAFLLSGFMSESSETTRSMLGDKASGKSLLLVEDSPFFRNLTAPYLSDVGYKVTTANSGEHALQILQTSGKQFDIIVTDIEMPGISGFELADTCRTIASISAIPIIAYTATISDEVRQRSEECGMLECIVKTDRAGLLQTVSQLLIEDMQVRH